MTHDPGGTTVRADVRRNHATIIAAAMRVLADSPEASMQEIAEASALNRATLYRHFTNREDLVREIRRLALKEAAEAITASRLDEGPVVDGIERLLRSLVLVGDRFRMLASVAPDPELEELEERVGAPLIAALERGRLNGELDPMLPARWMAGLVNGVIVTAQRAILAGDMTLDEAPDVVARTFLRGIAQS